MFLYSKFHQAKTEMQQKVILKKKMHCKIPKSIILPAFSRYILDFQFFTNFDANFDIKWIFSSLPRKTKLKSKAFIPEVLVCKGLFLVEACTYHSFIW